MLENLQVVKSETIDEVDWVSKVRGPHSLHINDDCFQTPFSISAKTICMKILNVRRRQECEHVLIIQDICQAIVDKCEGCC